MEAQIYKECVRYYPFVLGAQPVRLIDLAAFYAAIANEGVRPAPHVIETIEQQRPDHLPARSELRRSGSARPTAPRSTSSRPCCRACCSAARRARCGISRPMSRARPAPPTTRTTPGSSASPTTSPSRCGSATTTPTASAARSAAARPAAKVAVPIFEPIMQAAWAHRMPEDGAGAAVARGAAQLSCRSIDLATGERAAGAGGGITEQLPHRPVRPDSRHAISAVSREEAYCTRAQGYGVGPNPSGFFSVRPADGALQRQPADMLPGWRGRYIRTGAAIRAEPVGHRSRPRSAWCRDRRRAIRMDAVSGTPQRIDPDYIWGHRRSLKGTDAQLSVEPVLGLAAPVALLPPPAARRRNSGSRKPSVAGLAVEQLKPKTIAFIDPRATS